MKETQQRRRPESTLREPSLVVISASSTGLKDGFGALGTQQKGEPHWATVAGSQVLPLCAHAQPWVAYSLLSLPSRKGPEHPQVGG